MKFLRKFLDNTYKKVPEKFHPAIDALDTFAFTPNHTTSKGAHIRDGIDLKRTMFLVITALIPCLLFGMYNVGHQYYKWDAEFMNPSSAIWMKFGYGALQVLPIVLVSYAAGLFIEFIFAIKNGHAVQEGFLVSGMLIPLVVPASTPLWMVAIATIFAVLIGKEVFGGTGMNILNVALTARAFIFFAYPTKIIGNKVWIDERTDVDAFSGETALGELLSTTGKDLADPHVVSVVDKFGDGGLFNLTDSFLGFIPGSIGETSVLAILIGAGLLIWTGIGNWRIMLSMIGGGALMSYLFTVFNVNAFTNLDPLHQLCIGGFMFGAVFMATDPVTAAQTNTGKYIYGFLAGVIAMIIRIYNNAYPEGVMLAILFMNVMAPLIDHYVVQANVKKRLKRLKVQTA